MALEQIYFIAEIVAAVTVVASLIYVGIQLRQNTQTVRVAAGQAHVDAYDSMITKLLASDSLMAAWQQSATDLASLNAAQQLELDAWLGVVFHNFEGAYIQWREGVLDHRFWEGIRRSMEEIAPHQGVQHYWSFRRNWYSDEFGEWYDANVMAKVPQPQNG